MLHIKLFWIWIQFYSPSPKIPIELQLKLSFVLSNIVQHSNIIDLCIFALWQYVTYNTKGKLYFVYNRLYCCTIWKLLLSFITICVYMECLCRNNIAIFWFLRKWNQLVRKGSFFYSILSFSFVYNIVWFIDF